MGFLFHNLGLRSMMSYRDELWLRYSERRRELRRPYVKRLRRAYARSTMATLVVACAMMMGYGSARQDAFSSIVVFCLSAGAFGVIAYMAARFDKKLRHEYADMLAETDAHSSDYEAQLAVIDKLVDWDAEFPCESDMKLGFMCKHAGCDMHRDEPSRPTTDNGPRY